MDPGVVEGVGQQTACSLPRRAQGSEVEAPTVDREPSAQAEVVEEVGSSRLAKGEQLALRLAPYGGPSWCGRLEVVPKRGEAPLSGDVPCLEPLGYKALGALLAEGARRSWVAGAGVALTGQNEVLTRPPQ